MSIVSERLRAARTKKSLSQVDVMRLTKINNKTLSGYENAVSEPDYASLVLLSNIYGVTTDYLLGRVDNPTDELVPITTEPLDPNATYMNDPVTDDIVDNLKLMSREDKETIRRLTQSIVNRKTEGVS